MHKLLTSNIITIFLVISAIVGCKKEDKLNNTNIVVTSINSVTHLTSDDTAVYKNLDIDKDGINDFLITMRYQNDIRLGENHGVSVGGTIAGNAFLAHFGSVEGYFVNALTTSDGIQSSSAIWMNEALASLYWTQSRVNNIEGIDGKGNSIIGFRFLNDTDLHYGWLTLNVSSDYRTITILEAGYDKRPNTAILAGAK